MTSGFEYIRIYDGGSEYADLAETITGVHKQTVVSVPGNQMFVKFETSSKVATNGFRAFINKIGIIKNIQWIHTEGHNWIT